MTKAHVLRTFRLAGFPLVKLDGDVYQYVYSSSCVRVRYNPEHHAMALPGIRVYALKGNFSEFDSPTKALQCIRGRLGMAVVAGNDFALNTGPRGCLRLVAA